MVFQPDAIFRDCRKPVRIPAGGELSGSPP